MSRVAREPRLALAACMLLLGALIAFPLGVIASHQFGDVPDENPFHNDISAIAQFGVTTGCGGNNYCPSAFVTREQMAAFMNRLGALTEGKQPVVNALALNGIQSFGYQQVHASDSWVVDFPEIAAGACNAEPIGSVAAHGRYVLVNNAYDELSADGSTWDVSGYRKPNAETDDVFVKVCNLSNGTVNPPSVTFRWTLLK